MEILKITLLVFLSVILGLKAIVSHLTRSKEEIAQRVLLYTREKKRGESDSTDNQTGSKLFILFRLLAPRKLVEAAEQELLQADIPLRAEEFVIIQLGAVFIPVILGSLLLNNTAVTILLALVGAFVPILFLKYAKIRRLKRFNDQLGDGLLIMSNSLRAGYSFLQTLDSLRKESLPPLSTEVSRALHEMKLGTPTEEALQNMTKRVKSDDFDLIVTAVSIQRQVGGNLAEVLDNIASTIQERLRIKGEVRTLTAQGRISGVIVGLLPVFLAGFLFIINPTYMAILFKHPLGLALLGGALISEFIGILLIKKIVNIDY
jgi:tight adherence protein B